MLSHFHALLLAESNSSLFFSYQELILRVQSSCVFNSPNGIRSRLNIAGCLRGHRSLLATGVISSLSQVIVIFLHAFPYSFR